MSPTCPTCGARRDHGRARCLPLGRALSLIGGLALVTAYFMPWFGTQGIVLTGAFLNQFLGGAGDLRRFLPGSSGGPAEVQLLRALVLFFPLSGALAAGVAALGAVRPSVRPANLVLVVGGLAPLLALVVGLSRLPPGASVEVGLWLIGAGAITILLGVILEARGSGQGP